MGDTDILGLWRLEGLYGEVLWYLARWVILEKGGISVPGERGYSGHRVLAESKRGDNVVPC